MNDQKKTLREIHFGATAPHPDVAYALQKQVGANLAPFSRYLSRAIEANKSRHVRYRLPWRPVTEQSTIRLEPVSSVVRVPAQPSGYLLENWPHDQPYDLHSQGFVVDRSSTFLVLQAVRSSQGLVVVTDQVLFPGETVVWCGQQRRVSPADKDQPPREISDLDGNFIEILGKPRRDGDQHWLVDLGASGAWERLRVDGSDVDVEVLRPTAGLLSVRDGRGTSFPCEGLRIQADEIPEGDVLRGNNGVRFRWHVEQRGRERKGRWVELLPLENQHGDETVDPRAVFCDSELQEVWTSPNPGADGRIKVFRVDSDRYRLLLERLPPKDAKLHLPITTRNLELQRRAVEQLKNYPLPHHQGLLRLCEAPDKVRWPQFDIDDSQPIEWKFLRSPDRDGTDQQRQFVRKSLSTPDFAFLEGPPGSGKTTAICELISQLVMQGKRVLLCASTHVAVDNVLERLAASDVPIEAVRIGRVGRVDQAVQRFQLDVRAQQLVDAWQHDASFEGLTDEQLRRMAERTVVMAANLTCGTTTGIVNHPIFHDETSNGGKRRGPMARMPHWDMLIVDEASKTLVQEFLVPAMVARRWVVVGDVRQLPPFTDRADIAANLRSLVDHEKKPLFPPERQRARLLLFRLLERGARQSPLRWLIVEEPAVLDAIEHELATDERIGAPPAICRVVAKKEEHRQKSEVSVAELRQGKVASLRVMAAEWVLVPKELLAEVADRLPTDLVSTRKLDAADLLGETHPLPYALAYWESYAPALQDGWKERGKKIANVQDVARVEREFFATRDMGQELGWRLIRKHELRRGSRDIKYLEDQIERLLPDSTEIRSAVEEVHDIGMPSILEVLQEGIGEERSSRPGALTGGFRDTAREHFDRRFVTLTYQHRMHGDISRFPREVIYRNQALLDANTIEQREAQGAWNFRLTGDRLVWVDVRGREDRGVNREEVKQMRRILQQFLGWAKTHAPASDHDGGRWQVACLSFYTKQEAAISEMLRGLTGARSATTRFVVRDAPVEIVCGTVDRFQGREADMVLLSMRNTGRMGFLDSIHRLNVAVTRARELLIVVGNRTYFDSGRVTPELRGLVSKSRVVGTHFASHAGGRSQRT